MKRNTSLEQKRWYQRGSVAFLILFVLTATLFGLPVVSQNEDYIIAMQQMDAGVIMHGIQNLFSIPVYNQNNSFGTRMYGWPFQSTAFFLILILKGVGSLVGYYDNAIFFAVFDSWILNFSIRLLAYFFYLLAAFFVFLVARCVFRKSWVPIAISCLFATIPYSSNFAYFIHPDASGMFFFLAGLYLLIEKFYNLNGFLLSIIVALFTLSILSKQVYLLNVLFVVVLIIVNSNSAEVRSLFFRFYNKKNIFIIISIPFIVLFVVHPYAYFEPKKLIDGQILLKEAHSGNRADGYLQSLATWTNILLKDHLLVANFIAMPFALCAGLLKEKPKYYRCWIASFFYVCLFVFLILPLNAKLFYALHYVYPILPFVMFNIVVFFYWIFELIKSKSNGVVMGSCLTGIFGFLLVFEIVTSSIVSFNNGLLTAIYTRSTYMTVRNYMGSNISNKSKILVDPVVPYPVDFDRVCNTWNCSSYEQISHFSPDYIVLETGYKWVNNKDLKKYIDLNNFHPILTIRPSYTFQYPNSSVAHSLELFHILFDKTAIFGPEIIAYSQK